jgi:hypothetical protein
MYRISAFFKQFLVFTKSQLWEIAAAFCEPRALLTNIRFGAFVLLHILTADSWTNFASQNGNIVPGFESLLS